MSFAEEVRAELARLRPETRCCRRAELSALVRALGLLRLSAGDEQALELLTDNAALARRVFGVLKRDYGVRAAIAVGRRRTSRAKRYLLQVAGRDASSAVLAALRVWSGNRLHPGVHRDLVARRCCRRAYLRGFFLGRGSVTDPGKGHHLEIVAGNERMARDTARLMRSFGIEPGLTQRKGDWVVYVKGAEAIAGLLNVVGAHAALLKFENHRAYRGLKEQVNRIVNMETANLSRTVDGSARHLEAVDIIDNELGLGKLSPGLRAVAEARRQYPESTLEELGQLMSPPLTKSAVNHRLRRLTRLAAQLARRSP